VPIAVGVGLEKDCSSGIMRGIGGYGKWGTEVGKTEDWFGKEELFEAVERRLTSRRPIPWFVFLSEVDEGAGNVKIMINEATIEIGKAYY
jgi:hypothetical protein